MSKPRLLAILATALATTLVLAACGGDDDDDGGGEDEAAITEAIETSITSDDPADCTRLETQQFMEQTSFSTGEEAVQDCEEDAADTEDNADSAEVENVEIDGTTATADGTITGGVFDGATVTVDLVKEGEQWKLDRLTDVQGIDLEAFQDGFVEELTAQNEIPPPLAECMTQAIQETTEEDIKQAMIGGTEEDLLALFGDCLPTS